MKKVRLQWRDIIDLLIGREIEIEGIEVSIEKTILPYSGQDDSRDSKTKLLKYLQYLLQGERF